MKSLNLPLIATSTIGLEVPNCCDMKKSEFESAPLWRAVRGERSGQEGRWLAPPLLTNLDWRYGCVFGIHGLCGR
jgi:hypothetical protein